MEGISAAVDFMQKSVTAFGFVAIIGGAILLGYAFMSDNSADKVKGVGLMAGGIIVAAAGFLLVPQISSIFG